MKRSVLVLVFLVSFGWSSLALAQTSSITTACPVSYSCAFSAAETFDFGTSTGTAGQPNVYIGYLSFDSNGAVSLSGDQNLNGTVTTASSFTGTCAPGTNGATATITLSGGPTLTFVTSGRSASNPPAELDFIVTKDNNKSTTNGVRLGVCRAL